MHGYDTAVLSRLGQRLPSFDRLLAAHLILVELGEVVDDDRDGQRDDEHAADAAHAANELAQRRLGHNVAVPHSRHRDRRPPERRRDARVGLVVFRLFGEVGQAGEHQHADGEEHDEQAELLVAALQRVAERLQAGRVARQLQDAQDPHDPEDLDDAPHAVEPLRALVRLDEAQRDEVGHDGQQVDDVERTLGKADNGDHKKQVCEEELTTMGVAGNGDDTESCGVECNSAKEELATLGVHRQRRYRQMWD